MLDEKPAKILTNVWMDSHVEKITGGWKCGWCKQKFSGLNAHRVLSHLSRSAVYGTKGIKPCEGPISEAKLAEYQGLAARKMIKRDSQHKALAERRMMLQNHTDNITSQYISSQVSQTVSTYKPVTVTSSQQINHTGTVVCRTNATRPPLSDLTSKTSANKLQLLQTKLDYSNFYQKYILENKKLEIAIADFFILRAFRFQQLKMLNLNT